MNKSEIVKLSDDQLIDHCLKYRKYYRQNKVSRHVILQFGWSMEEIEKRGILDLYEAKGEQQNE